MCPKGLAFAQQQGGTGQAIGLDLRSHKRHQGPRIVLPARQPLF